MVSAAAVMNRVPRDKLPQVLSHVLEKRASAVDATEVFSPGEIQQLVGMLQLSVEEIEEVVAVATTIFQQAAAFGDGVQSTVLVAEGVDSDVVTTIEKLWRKKGRPLADALAHAMPLEPSASLKQSQWQLQVELANRHLGKQSEPLAVFQLQIADDDSTEKVDVEMKHGELLAFFQQLNSIQKALDETAATAAP